MTMKARRILVQEQHNRICPWCGEKLVLRGNILGVQYNDWEFGQKFTNASMYKAAFENDDLWSFGEPMFCEKCGIQIQLQNNPMIAMKITLFFSLVCLLIGFLAAFYIRSYLWVTIAIIVLFVMAVVFILMLCKLKMIKKWRSNFVYVTDDTIDSLKPDLKVKISTDVSKEVAKVLYPSNVFMIPWQQCNIWLELLNVDRHEKNIEVSFRICEAYKKVKKNLNLHATISLYFEGVFIANAKVIELI